MCIPAPHRLKGILEEWKSVLLLSSGDGPPPSSSSSSLFGNQLSPRRDTPLRLNFWWRPRVCTKIKSSGFTYQKKKT